MDRLKSQIQNYTPFNEREADETEAFQIKPDENSAICWMTFAEIEQAINDGDKKMDPLFLKLIEKTKTLT